LQQIDDQKREVAKKHLSMRYLEKEIKVNQMEHIERAIESMPPFGQSKQTSKPSK